VLITDGGSVDAQLAADPSHHTLGDLANEVFGHLRNTTIAVDGVAWPSETALLEAGVRRGSTIDLTHDTSPDQPATDEPGSDRPPAARLIESAGFGGRRQIALEDGTYRIGPTRRINAPHLTSGPVDDALLVIDVAGEIVTIEAAPGHGAALDGELLLGPTRWVDGPLVIDDRVLDLTPTDLGPTLPAGPLTALPVGRSLVPDDQAAPVELDAMAGIGIVADPDDALAILRSIALTAAIGTPDDVGAIDLAIESDRPHVWEWTKWLPEADPGASASRLMIIDRTDPDATPASLPTGCAVVVAAASPGMLPARLGSIMEPVGAGRAAAVRATTIVDGTPVDHRRIAPYTLEHDVALHHARAMSRSMPAPHGAARDDLTISPWYVYRTATPTERRALRWRAGDPAHVTVEGHRPEPTPTLVAAAGAIDATRYIVPIGVWADRRTVATLPLASGGRLAVIGPEDDARAQLLALILDGIGQAEAPSGVPVDLFALAPRGGPSVAAARRERLALDVADEARDVRGWLDRITTAPRPFVVVDGAERVGGPSMRWLAGDDFGHATVVVAAAHDLDDAHWTQPWHDRWMSIRLHPEGRTASVASRHRTREVLLVGPDDPDRPTADTSVDAPGGHHR